MLKVENFSKIFKNTRGVRNLNFEIPVKSFTVLMGPNGSGKTTLIRSILRIYQEYDGEISIFGIKNKNPLCRQDISYIGEAAIFPRNIKLEDYLFWAAKLRNMENSKIRARVRNLVTTFQMEKFLNKKPFRFSSGEKQKVMLMKAILEDSKLIIMDEPTSNLDPEAREIFFSEVEKLNKQGKSVLVCSHNLDELEDKVSHVLMISMGEQKYFASKLKNKKLIEIFHENK